PARLRILQLLDATGLSTNSGFGGVSPFPTGQGFPRMRPGKPCQVVWYAGVQWGQPLACFLNNSAAFFTALLALLIDPK
ncbi:MAG: hypothetical protein WAW36_00205, partial [Methylovulum miyakonense]|uniref:hypothetical protein n=1 Tax=Methylovulum miyakonense TaxID=645578 RepID=UPI003BB6DAC1